MAGWLSGSLFDVLDVGSWRIWRPEKREDMFR